MPEVANSTCSRASSDTLKSVDSGKESWGDRLRRYSSRSAAEHLLSGNHLNRFASFVHRPVQNPAQTFEEPVAFLYDFYKESPRLALRALSELHDLKISNDVASHHAQLLLLRGYPPPGWLLAIGEAFDVDVECLHHHMEPFSSQPLGTAWTSSPLISRSATQPRLRLTTLGHLSRPDDKARKVSRVRDLRAQADGIFNKYLRSVRQEKPADGKGDPIQSGDSLLRGISVHDASNFSLEQEVSIFVKGTSKGWFALAWLDIGSRNLALGPEGHLLLAPLGGDRDQTVYGSTVFGRADDMDKVDNIPYRATGDIEGPDCIVQNAMHLCENYAQGIDRRLACKDAFYALSNLFRFAAATETQFLGMMNHVVEEDNKQAHVLGADDADDASLSNLPYNQQVLRKHRKRIQENLQAIRARKRWPRVSMEHESDAVFIEREATQLEDDFDDLLGRAKDLADECDRILRTVMTQAKLAESQKAIAQAERVEWLTRLATIFIPLSFTATFFGMNFKQFGQGDLQLWIWCAVSAPVVLLSLILLITKLRRKVFGLLRICCRRRGEPEQDIEMQRVDLVH